jgi:hypothetical protein
MRLGRGVAADLHLHAAKAASAVALGLAGNAVDALPFLVEAAGGIGLDPIAAGAEKLVHRQPGDLAGDVPQRDVDAADRIYDDAAPPELPRLRKHLLPVRLDQQRILPDQERRHNLVDDGGRDAAAEPGFADADDAAVGLDLHQQPAAPRLHPGGAGVGRIDLARQRDRANGGDFHGQASRNHFR